MTQSQREKKPRKQTTPAQSPTVKPSSLLGVNPLMAQQAMADAAQADSRNLLKLQRTYGNRAMSDLIQTRRIETVLSQPIQRTEADGQPDKLENVYLDPAEFKKYASSGDQFVTTIELWLKAARDAQSWTDQQHALNQVADGCDTWLNKYGNDKKPKEKASITNRRILINEVRSEASRKITTRVHSLANSNQTPAGPSEGEEEERNKTAMGSEFLGLAAAPDKIGGDMSDIKKGYDEGAIMGTGGGEKIAGIAEIPLAGGVGDTAKGVLDLANIWTDKSKSKGEKAHETLPAGSQLIAGTGNIVRGVGLKGVADQEEKLTATSEFKQLSEEGQEDALKPLDKAGKGWDQIGDAMGGAADSLNAIAGLITFCRNMVKTNVKDTWQDYLQAGTDRSKEVIAVAQSGVKAGLNITKAAAKGADSAKGAVAGMTTASGALGIVLGTIELVQGGLKIYQGIKGNNSIKKAQQEEKALSAKLHNNIAIIQASPIGPDEAEAVEQYLIKLYRTVLELDQARKKYAPAMAGMKKLGSHRMEEGAFKMATGTTAVVSGALLVSGVGAPIAIGIAAIGGILALTKAGTAWRRNAAADRLTTTALRLTDEGQPTATPDAKTPDYRTMEKRVYKCYYTHIPEVIFRQTPAGLTKDNFLDVKRFAWSDKKERVPYKQTHPIDGDTGQLIPSQDSDTVRNNWLVYSKTENNKKVARKEEPTNWDGTKLTFSASAHKSKQSLEASKAEVVDALYTLGSQSWKPVEGPVTKKGKPAGIGSFVEAPIVPIDADAETLKQYGQITLQALLRAANITPALWQKWLDQSKGDEKKMKELIGSKLG